MIEYPGTGIIDLCSLKTEPRFSNRNFLPKENFHRQIILPTFENITYNGATCSIPGMELEFFKMESIAFSNFLRDDYFFKIEKIDDRQILFIFEKKSLEVIGEIELEHIFDFKDCDFFTVRFYGKIMRVCYHLNGEVIFHQTFEKSLDGVFISVEIEKTIFDDFINEHNRSNYRKAFGQRYIFILEDGRIYQCCNDTGLILNVFYFGKSKIESFDIHSSDISKIRIGDVKFLVPKFSEKEISSIEIYKEYLILRERYIDLREKYEKSTHNKKENLLLLMLRSILIGNTLRLYRVSSK